MQQKFQGLNGIFFIVVEKGNHGVYTWDIIVLCILVLHFNSSVVCYSNSIVILTLHRQEYGLQLHSVIGTPAAA